MTSLLFFQGFGWFWTQLLPALRRARGGLDMALACLGNDSSCSALWMMCTGLVSIVPEAWLELTSGAEMVWAFLYDKDFNLNFSWNKTVQISFSC